uniref:Uncharacterized protein n=1 Tax=Meloidogyne floridensis TaxID=298350 RepID=A0A915P915_9BILA
MNLTIAIYFILLFECSFENGNNEQVVLRIFSDFEKDILLLMETEVQSKHENCNTNSAISKLELFLNSIYPLIEKLEMNNIQNDLIDFQVISRKAFQHYLNEFQNRSKLQNYINLFVVINKFWSEIAEKKINEKENNFLTKYFNNPKRKIPDVLKDHINSIKAFSLAENVLKTNFNELTKHFLEYTSKKQSSNSINYSDISQYIEDNLQIPKELLINLEKEPRNMKKIEKIQNVIMNIAKLLLVYARLKKLFLAFKINFVQANMVVKELVLTKEAMALSYAIFNPDVPNNDPGHLLMKNYNDIISKYIKDSNEPSTKYPDITMPDRSGHNTIINATHCDFYSIEHASAFHMNKCTYDIS